MAAPIYFFPSTPLSAIVKNGQLDHEFFKRRGVAKSFTGERDARASVSIIEITGKGPGGHSGVLITPLVNGQPPLRLGFFPDFQTWHEKPAGCDAWVGIDKEYPPTPGDLQIGQLLRGSDVQLGDGNLWRVPIVRTPFSRDQMGRSSLPRDFVYDADGIATGVRQASSDHLWELSGQVWDHSTNREKFPTIDLQVLLEVCIEALALNYRFGKAEQQVLRLINSTNWEAISDALLDVALVDEAIELQKKTQESHPAALPSASRGATA